MDEEELSNVMTIKKTIQPKPDPNDKLFYIKLPATIRLEPTMFDVHEYIAKRSKETVDLLDVARWRNMDKSNNINGPKESNTKIVEWEDGSMHLFIGKRSFQIDKKPISRGINELFCIPPQTQTAFTCHGSLQEKMTLIKEDFTTPGKIADKRKPTLKLEETLVDPEEEKKKLLKELEKNEQKKARRERNTRSSGQRVRRVAEHEERPIQQEDEDIYEDEQFLDDTIQPFGKRGHREIDEDELYSAKTDNTEVTREKRRRTEEEEEVDINDEDDIVVFDDENAASPSSKSNKGGVIDSEEE